MYGDLRLCHLLTCKLSRWRFSLPFIGRIHTHPVRRGYTTTSQIIANSGPPGGVLGDSLPNEPPSIYVNPVCMQLDQLLYSCDDYDSLLGLLVTHRGVMYLHNLVTVMILLRNFAEKDDPSFQPDADDLLAGYSEIHRTPSSDPAEALSPPDLTETQKKVLKKAQSEILVHLKDPQNEHYMRASQHSRRLSEAIIRDERYDLLLQDLYVNRNKLDIASACHVIISLDSLGHKYFRLYNGILKHLLRMPLDDGNLPSMNGHLQGMNGNLQSMNATLHTMNNIGNLLIQTCHCYVRAGFHDIPLYTKVCRELFRGISSGSGEGFDELLINVVRLYGSVTSYDYCVFEKIAQIVRKKKLSAHDTSLLALAFSAHQNCTKLHDEIMYKVANEIEARPLEFTTRDLYSCVHSFSKMSLYFEKSWRTFSQRLVDEISHSINTAEELQFSIPELCSIVEQVCRIDNASPFVHKLVEYTLLYLEDHIDGITEDSAINVASAISLTNSHETNTYILPFIWRRIGSDVTWEKNLEKVFGIWVTHMLRFPHFKYNICQRCIIPCLREWLLIYNTRHELFREIEEVVKVLRMEMDVYTKDSIDVSIVPGAENLLQSPIPMDVILVDEKLGKKVVNIVDNSVRNRQDSPVGIDLQIKGIIEDFGFNVSSINRHFWVGMNLENRVNAIRSIFLSS